MNEIASLIIEQKIGITQTDLQTTMQIYNRYLNVKPIFVITNDITRHQRQIEDKFDIYIWIRDSVRDLLAINVGKHTHVKKESKNSILNFISSIIEQVKEAIVYYLIIIYYLEYAFTININILHR